MESLQQIWDRLNEQGYGSDKGSVHSYLPLYEQILAPYRDTALNVLEIGIFKGDSLRLWESYFTKANVHGIDCDEQPHGGMADLRPMIETGQHHIHIMDATDEVKIKEVFRDTKWDVIWDDAAHHIEQQVQLINVFKNRMNKGAIYIIEDVQDIDKDKWIFDSMSGNFTVDILDCRNTKRRYDDCLVILKFN